MMGRAEKIDVNPKVDAVRKLILENPNLPIIVATSWDVVGDSYGWWYSDNVTARVDNVIYWVDSYGDIKYIDDEEDLEEYIIDSLDEDYGHLDNEDFDELVEKTLQSYDSLWTKCIIIYADV